MNQLNRFDRYSLKYFMYTAPVFIIFMTWAAYNFAGVADKTTLNGGVWDYFAWFFIPWVLILLYVVTKMLFSKSFRDTTMARLAGIKERDEREAVVAGNAAKYSFLSTFALLLFMLVFSVTTFNLEKLVQPTPTKNGSFAIGFGMKVLDDKAYVHEVKDGVEKYNYSSIPLSKPFMIILLMVWQIGTYQLVARRELKE